MQPNKTKLALQIGAVVLGALCASNSYADTFTATVNTVADVGIAPRVGQPLDFGPNVLIDALGECTMLATNEAGLGTPGGTLMNYGRADNAAAADAAFGTIAGTGCVDSATDTTGGIWDLTGAPGVTVSLLISDVVQTPSSFTFVPAGCYVSYNGDDTTNSDSCVALAANAVVTARFAATGTDEDDTAGLGTDGAVAVAGQFSIAVGGVLTVGALDLDAATDYDLAFQIDVTY